MTKVDIYISFESKMLDNDDFMEQLKFISAKYENKWLFIYYKDKRPYLHLKYNVDKITEIYYDFVDFRNRVEIKFNSFE
jgi:hypothetical protein